MMHGCGCGGRYTAAQKVKEVSESAPAREILARFGIDQCGGGHLSLAAAAAAAGVSLEALLAALHEGAPA